MKLKNLRQTALATAFTALALILLAAALTPPAKAEVLSFRQIRFFITLNGGEERIPSSGPLRYIARCIVSSVGGDAARIIATSTQDGWFE
jgi:hypothetical protein